MQFKLDNYQNCNALNNMGADKYAYFALLRFNSNSQGPDLITFSIRYQLGYRNFS